MWHLPLVPRPEINTQGLWPMLPPWERRRDPGYQPDAAEVWRDYQTTALNRLLRGLR
jgi:hypothetical protein